MGDEWIEWDGKGKRPVAYGVVDVRFRDGDIVRGHIIPEICNHSYEDASWRHIWGDADIVAYRVVEP